MFYISKFTLKQLMSNALSCAKSEWCLTCKLALKDLDYLQLKKYCCWQLD